MCASVCGGAWVWTGGSGSPHYPLRHRVAVVAYRAEAVAVAGSSGGRGSEERRQRAAEGEGEGEGATRSQIPIWKWREREGRACVHCHCAAEAAAAGRRRQWSAMARRSGQVGPWNSRDATTVTVRALCACSHASPQRPPTPPRPNPSPRRGPPAAAAFPGRETVRHRWHAEKGAANLTRSKLRRHTHT